MQERAAQISSATGVPVPFEVVYEGMVVDAPKAERLVHVLLSEHRVNPRREFFQVPLEIAVRAVYQMTGIVNEVVMRSGTWIRLHALGGASAKLLPELLGPHRGGVSLVSVYYSNDDSSAEIWLPEEWRVKCSEQLLWTLCEWFGTEYVELVYPDTAMYEELSNQKVGELSDDLPF